MRGRTVADLNKTSSASASHHDEQYAQPVVPQDVRSKLAYFEVRVAESSLRCFALLDAGGLYRWL